MTAMPWWAIAHTDLRHNSAQQKHTHTHKWPREVGCSLNDLHGTKKQTHKDSRAQGHPSRSWTVNAIKAMASSKTQRHPMYSLKYHTLKCPLDWSSPIPRHCEAALTAAVTSNGGNAKTVLDTFSDLATMATSAAVLAL